jgi:hypothetical protein
MASRQKSGVHAGQRDQFRQKFFRARHAAKFNGWPCGSRETPAGRKV